MLAKFYVLKFLDYLVNCNKAGLFEGHFFWGGGQFDPQPPLDISRRTNLMSI